MLIKKPADIASAEITPKDLYLNRRKFLLAAGAIAGAGVAGGKIGEILIPPSSVLAGTKLEATPSSFSTTEKQTPFNDITHYNNYYEFSTDKYEPADLAKNFNTRPWTIKVEGL